MSISVLSNEFLELKADSAGAQMSGIRSCYGNDFLWEGNPRYWKEQAPNLFPYVGRLTESSYVLDGKKYSMNIHGFAKASEFEVIISRKMRRRRRGIPSILISLSNIA